jgi:hypothetical protein
VKTVIMFRNLSKSLSLLTKTSQCSSFTPAPKLFPSGINFRSRFYGSEAAEIAGAVKEGDLTGVPRDLMERCPVCSRSFHEMREGYSPKDAKAAPSGRIGCAVGDLWVKEWMTNHDSINLSGDHLDDDERISRIGEKAVVIPSDPQAARKLKCGLYCCQD